MVYKCLIYMYVWKLNFSCFSLFEIGLFVKEIYVNVLRICVKSGIIGIKI